MKFSYDGIGQWAATFACQDSDNLQAGSLVKISDNATISSCSDNDRFCGSVLSISRDQNACAVILDGIITANFSGTAPTVGWSGLAANGTGGVKSAASAHPYLVIDVDDTAKTVTFLLS